jgi:hypothetical protein
MQKLKSFMTLVGITCIPFTIFGTNLTLINAEGSPVEVVIDSTEKFSDVMQNLTSYFNDGEVQALNHPTTMTFIVANDQVVVRKKGTGRNYWTPVSSSDKKDIAYIVNTLARDSLISIASSRSSLNKAGDRIDNVHPLRFLMAIFGDEELKAGAHAIRDRGSFIWDGFLEGVIRGSTEETARNNMKVEFIQDFAREVKIDANLIIPSIQQSKWKELVNILIDRIPRANDPNRYDM